MGSENNQNRGTNERSTERAKFVPPKTEHENPRSVQDLQVSLREIKKPKLVDAKPAAFMEESSDITPSSSFGNPNMKGPQAGLAINSNVRSKLQQDSLLTPIKKSEVTLESRRNRNKSLSSKVCKICATVNSGSAIKCSNCGLPFD